MFYLRTDASACGVGTVLNVERDGVVLPVAFFSRQLRGPETRYSAMELEGLAVYCAVMYFAHFLYGRTFKVFTDHKALVAFCSSKVLNRRLQGWTLRMQDFDFSVVYRRGSDNGNADGLSRQAMEIVEDVDAEDGRHFSRGGCGDGAPQDEEKRKTET